MIRNISGKVSMRGREMCEDSVAGAAGAGQGGVPVGAAGVPGVHSAALLQGGREVLIHHDGQIYRLRLTASNKLILVK
jgi:hypothetical protein